MTIGNKKEAYLYLLFHYTGKRRFSREHTKNPNANDRARPDVTFWAAGYHYHYENTLTCKRISWESGGMMF